jgi:alkanesulfonate monooxygenase SsuD/methylene tetrahydromethanopterin reductase-like flavin-dependent oxidoreductase (luciferase family)
LQQQFINLRRGTPGQLPPPVKQIPWNDAERAGVEHSLACSVIGDQRQVEAGLASLIEQTQPDELMVTAQIYDHAARLRSFEITAQARAAVTA